MGPQLALDFPVDLLDRRKKDSDSTDEPEIDDESTQNNDVNPDQLILRIPTI